MAVKTAAELAITVSSDVGDAARGFSTVGDAATGAARQVSDAGAAADKASRGFSVSADAADDMAGKTGKATGALGALSSGFELVGAEKYAGALQGASMATDFLSGVGDSLNLVMESTIVKSARARVMMVAQRGATIATAVAQRALNLAMRANPIGLIITAVTLLVAGLVLAYKKSETFRNIVQAAGRLGKEAFQKVVDVLSSLTRVASRVVGWVRDRIPAAIEVAKTIFGKIGDAFTAPFQAVFDLVENIVNFISKIKVPSIPNPFRTAGSGSTSATTASGYDPSSVALLQAILQVLRDMAAQARTPADPYALVATLETLLYRYGRGYGAVTTVGGA